MIEPNDTQAPGSSPDGSYAAPECYSPVMAGAAIVLGILAIIFSMVFYIAIPLGALAILLGLLSRGNSTLLPRARAGIITAVLAILISTVITASTAAYIYRTPALRAYFLELWDYYSGLYETQFSSDPQDILPGEALPGETLPGTGEELLPGSPEPLPGDGGLAPQEDQPSLPGDGQLAPEDGELPPGDAQPLPLISGGDYV